jgi:hypothetical protein
MSFANTALAGGRRTTRSGDIPGRGALTPPPGALELVASDVAAADPMPLAVLAAGVAVFGGVEPGVDEDAAPGGFTSDARSEATLAGADGGDWLIAGLTNRVAYDARI